MLRRLSFAWLYLFKPPWDSGIPAPELVRIAQDFQGAEASLTEPFVASATPDAVWRALDLGCGTGTNVRYLAERGWHVTGLDFIPHAIAQARRKVRGHESAVTLLVGDVTKLETLPLPGPYDLALDMGCYHSLPADGRQRYAAGLRHWLKPGGLFMLYAFQPDPAHKLWGLTRDQVMAEIGPGFQLTNYEQGQGRPSAWYYFTRIAD